MKEQPKVTVIIPSLNVVHYIGEAIESVVNQTLKNIEILCIDAGSTDGTLDIIQKYSSKDSRVKLIHSEKKSYGYQINLGIRLAKGEFIGIVETDDYVLPDMYRILYEVADRENVDIVKSNFCRFVGDGDERTFQNVPLTYWNKEFDHFYNKVINPENDLNIFNLLKNNVTGLFKREFLLKNDIRLNETPGASFQDNGLWFLAFVHAERCYFLDEYFYCCRRDNPNSSVKDKGKVYVICDEYDYILKRLKENKYKYHKFITAYWMGKFGSYNFTYSRISEEFKFKFLLRICSEFQEAKEKNEIDESLFPKGQWNRLKAMMDDPKAFYISDLKKRTYKNSDYDEIRICLIDSIRNITEERTSVNEREEKIKVSVIVPVYNLEEHLQACLDSIVNQTLKDIEIICIDDGSLDKSLAVLYVNFLLDGRIKVFSQKNLGAGPARNFGIKESVGEFVAFIDGDDWYPDPDILEKLYNLAKENDVKICGGSVCSWCEDHFVRNYPENLAGNTFEEDGRIKYSDYQYDYSYQRFIYQRKMIVDNNIFFPEYRRYQDPPFFIKAMIEAGEFYAIKDITYCYRYIKKEISYDFDKIKGILLGLIDDLEISKKFQLKKLHELTLYRCENDFCGSIISLQYIKNAQLLHYLICLNNSVDRTLIDIDSSYVIKPLRELVYKPAEVKINEGNIRENECLKKEMSDLRNSYSFKVGRIITYFPRKLRGAIWCCRDHGLLYTVHRFFEKILNFIKEKKD